MQIGLNSKNIWLNMGAIAMELKLAINLEKFLRPKRTGCHIPPVVMLVIIPPATIVQAFQLFPEVIVT